MPRFPKPGQDCQVCSPMQPIPIPVPSPAITAVEDVKLKIIEDTLKSKIHGIETITNEEIDALFAKL